jgi:hypothetical protein
MTTNEVKLPFEITETDDDNVVFIKNISKSGKTPKQLREIKAKLPRTTIQYFSEHDLERLKEIEYRLLIKMELNHRYKEHSFFSILKQFLEI